MRNFGMINFRCHFSKYTSSFVQIFLLPKFITINVTQQERRSRSLLIEVTIVTITPLVFTNLDKIGIDVRYIHSTRQEFIYLLKR